MEGVRVNNFQKPPMKNRCQLQSQDRDRKVSAFARDNSTFLVSLALVSGSRGVSEEIIERSPVGQRSPWVEARSDGGLEKMEPVEVAPGRFLLE
jgi:hypothetical protein